MKLKNLALVFLGIFIFTGEKAFCVQTEQSLASAAFVQGAASFKRGEWGSAVFSLRKAVSYPENFNAETWYMLITAQMYAGEYKAAAQDCSSFLRDFSESPYVSYIIYHRGRALFFMGEYEKSVLLLSDFCHQYTDHENYASALFWIAESFYAGYNYEDAKLLYNRIILEFPDDAKAAASQYRLESIAQIAREEKLLYLLRETGEEYLAAREDYERQLMFVNSASTAETRQKLMDMQQKNSDLIKKNLELEKSLSELKSRFEEEVLKNADIKTQNMSFLDELRIKALWAQDILEAKTSKGGTK